MAKSKPIRQDENSAAALAALEKASSDIARAEGTLKGRLEELGDQVQELTSTIEHMTEQHREALQGQKERFETQIRNLAERLAGAEDKLKRAAQTLSF